MKVLHICSDTWRDRDGFSKVAMKIGLIDNQPTVEQFQNFLTPHDKSILVSNRLDPSYDFIVCWGVTQMRNAEAVHRMFPNIPLINYNWDIYEWAVKNPRPQEYDYRVYVEFLLKSKEVWVPSKAVADRTKQWFKEWHNTDGPPIRVIKSHSPIYELETTDGDFVLNAQRANPDERIGWFERACEELNIPYKSTKHELSQEEFRKVLASCTFQVSPYYEMSTGGLMILEGYYNGKPVLLSDSKWQGGGEYMGDRATYFKHDDFEDLKAKIKDMWENRDKYKVPKDHKEWILKNYSEEAFAKRIHDGFVALS